MDELTVKLVNNQLKKEISRIEDVLELVCLIKDKSEDEGMNEKISEIYYELKSDVAGLDALSEHLSGYYIE